LHHKSQVLKHFGVLMTKKYLFSQLLKKAVSMALWTKAITCDKAGFKSKANFQKSQMNVNDYIAVDYEEKDTWSSGNKQSQTNPNKAKTNPIKANKTPKQTQNEPNSNPIKPNLSRRSLWRSRISEAKKCCCL